MASSPFRSLKRAIQVILVLAPLGLVGCGGGGGLAWPGRGPKPHGPASQTEGTRGSAARASASSSQVAALAVGQPAVSKLLSEARSANLVICVLDAARADHLGCYGYARDTTPNIDQLAGESVIFRNHFAPCSSTRASTASLFTGLYPDSHRIAERETLDEGIFTLGRALKAAGFRTALFSSNINVSPETGLGSEFDKVFPKRGTRGGIGQGQGGAGGGQLWRGPESLTREFAKWLARERPSRFFAYLHILPPHSPYEAPDAFTELFAQQEPPPVQRRPFEFPEVAPAYAGFRSLSPRRWVNLYDANLRWADWGLGEVVRLLRERGLLDNTLLVVTSDHGEAFGEHGYINHALAVYDEFVHIPLLIRFPGRQRLVGEVTPLTQTVDLLPTICDSYRTPYPREAVQGNSLLPLLDGERNQVRDYVFAVSGGSWPSYLVRNSRWSLILYRGGKLRALYDLGSDPAQTRNVIAEHPETAAQMIAAFEAFARTQARSLAEFVSPHAEAAPRAPQGKLSPEVRRELEALGYLR